MDALVIAVCEAAKDLKKGESKNALYRNRSCRKKIWRGYGST